MMRAHLSAFGDELRMTHAPDKLFRRQEIADALCAEGFPTSRASLTTLASRGDGPPFSKFGRIVLYRWDTSLEWAKARMTPPATTATAHRLFKAEQRAARVTIPRPKTPPKPGGKRRGRPPKQQAVAAE